MNTVLTIAGSDPSGGAGIQADQRVIEAYGQAALSVTTALTAQNTLGVDAVYPVDADIVRHQLRTLLADIRPGAVKIGMLGSAAQVDAIADLLTEFAQSNIVLDPVLASTAGVPFLDDDGIDVLLRRLMPLAAVITPNLHEAERLSGVPSDQAAAKLLSMGARAVLLKGGHLDGDPIDTLTFTTEPSATSPSPIPMGEGAGGEGPVLLKGGHLDGDPIDTLTFTTEPSATSPSPIPIGEGAGGEGPVLLKGGHLDGDPIDTLTFTTEPSATSPSPIPMGEGAGGEGPVLLKGGHLDGDPIDTLTFTTEPSATSPSPIPMGEGAGGEGPVLITHHFPGHRVDTPHTHGTGCFLASAIAANLAFGLSLEDAIDGAKATLTSGLMMPTIVGQGRGYPSIDFPLSSREQFAVKHANSPNRFAGLYVLTDPTLRPDRSPIDIVAAALAGGARIIQMRDKSTSTPELIELARKLRQMCREARAYFFVNDRVDIAIACEADGVHLGPDDMSPIDAYAIVGHTMAIGVSVSSVEEAEPIAPYADYLGVGAIYGSSTKLDAGAAVGVDRIRQIKAAFPHHPIVAIGGIDASNIGDVITAGADSVAVISAVLSADDMVEATRALTGAFTTSI